MSPEANEARARRAMLQARLSRPRDPTERGQTLARTAAALARAGVGRLEGLVAALRSERVIVAVRVEAGPRVPGQRVLPGEGEQRARLERVESAAGPALAVYTSAAQLARADAGARPMPQSVRPVALAALEEARGHLLVDPAGAAVLIPRPATAALAQGDAWLPPWRDAELAEELRRLARAAGGGAIRDVRVLGGPGPVVRVEVVVGEDPRGRQPARSLVASALRAVAASPRLSAAAERVELVPTRVRLV